MYLGKLGPAHVCCGAYPEHRDHCANRTLEPPAAPDAGGGRVITTPSRKHDCSPGWTTKTGSDGRSYGVPPTSWSHPKGTLWECDCGKTWVSQGATSIASPGFIWWRREGRLARWRRTRNATAR